MDEVLKKLGPGGIPQGGKMILPDAVVTIRLNRNTGNVQFSFPNNTLEAYGMLEMARLGLDQRTQSTQPKEVTMTPEQTAALKGDAK